MSSLHATVTALFPSTLAVMLCSERRKIRWILTKSLNTLSCSLGFQKHFNFSILTKICQLFVSELCKIECRSFDHEAKTVTLFWRKFTCSSWWYSRKKKEKCSVGVNFLYPCFLPPCESGSSHLFGKQNVLHNFQIRSKVCHAHIW